MFLLRPALRPISWLALCAFILGSSLPVWDEHPLGAADDAACFTAAAWESVEHPHVTADSTAPGQSEHCVYCHLQRAMAGAAVAHPPALFTPAPSVSILAGVESLALALAAPARPSRAPPVSTVI